jgi:outer membrane protein TolC
MKSWFIRNNHVFPLKTRNISFGTLILIFGLFGKIFTAVANNNDSIHHLTIEQAVELALNNSNDSRSYRNFFLASYWSFRSFEARHLPSVSLSATLPSYTKRVQQGVDKGEIYFYSQNTLTESMQLSVNQNIALTGGVISFHTSLNRVDQFSPSRSTSYNSAPFGLTYWQSLTTTNWMKWDKKLSPMYFESAKRSYMHNMEAVRTTAIAWFFNLMTAQQNLLMARENLANTDTLYKITQKKFEIGAIGRDELMQMKLTLLNSENSVDQNIMNVEAMENGFRSYVGIKDQKKIQLIVPLNVPEVLLNYDEVLQAVKKNHIQTISNQTQLLQAERNLATEIGEARPDATLYISVGANQNAEELVDAYKNIRDYQVVSLGLKIPIADWGLRKGNVQMAKANLEALKGRVSQNETDLEHSVYLSVMRYNMMPKRMRVVAESDTIARSRYDASRERFLAGRITVTDLNIAQAEKNNARASFINAIREYWSYYYEIQRISLFDFIGRKEIDVDFNNLARSIGEL